MSIPASKEAQDQLKKLVAANDKAGDWTHIALPKGLVGLVGDVRLPRRKKK
jgi:hypothetical protein